MKPVNVIVTCTKQKSLDAPAAMQLRNLQGMSVASRLQGWKRQADHYAGEFCTARRLYAGDHWAVAKSLEQTQDKRSVIQVWVISAGFGLVSLDTPIAPYSATFSTRHPDTVVLPGHVQTAIRAAEDKREWWNGLTTQRWTRERPISLRDLAAEFPDCPMVLAASANYLYAVQDDLLAARELLDDPDQLAVFSAGTEELSGLTEHLIPCDARLQPLVGGILRSLNVRVLRHYLNSCGSRGMIGVRAAKRTLEKWLAAAPERPRYDRAPASDEEVRQFVSRAMQVQTRVSRTGLLQAFRQSGRACEQNRFKALFGEVEAERHG